MQQYISSVSAPANVCNNVAELHSTLHHLTSDIIQTHTNKTFLLNITKGKGSVSREPSRHPKLHSLFSRASLSSQLVMGVGGGGRDEAKLLNSSPKHQWSL